MRGRSLVLGTSVTGQTDDAVGRLYKERAMYT